MFRFPAPPVSREQRPVAALHPQGELPEESPESLTQASPVASESAFPPQVGSESE